MHEERLQALREAAWNGRAEGMDVSKSLDFAAGKQSLRLMKANASKSKKNLQRGELPPLNEVSSNNAVRIVAVVVVNV